MPVGEYAGANSYTGNGVTTSFAYSFRVLDDADILVTVDGVTKALTTDYTVDGVGEANGGDVIFNSAPASSAAIVISRNRAYTRETDYQRNGSFDEETVDADFDGIVMLVQQLYADRIRSFKAPVEVTDDQVLTAAMWAARASTLLGFDENGDFGVFGATDFGTTVASAFMLTLLDDTTDAAARTTLGAAASGANSDITSLAAPSLGAATATTAAANDSSTKVATTAFVAGAGFTTGDVKLTLKTTADSGWVLMDDKTIGDASSGATGRANADTEALFTLLWNNTANAQCAVSTGRGASAAADFAAHKTIALPKALGRALATYGAGSGLTSRALALTTGNETHTLSTGEIPAHTHHITAAANNTAGGNVNFWAGNGSGGTAGLDTDSGGGSGGAHNNMQPTLFLNTMIKL